MFDIPLHPAVVHVPLGIALIMPILVLGIWIAILKRWIPSRTWVFLILLQLILFGTGLLAMNAGEQDEEIVERVVNEQVIEAHEEKAEVFVWVSGVLCLLLVAGLWPHPRYGNFIRGLCFAGVIANLIVAALVGHSGGELVYKYNAASAHVNEVIK